MDATVFRDLVQWCSLVHFVVHLHLVQWCSRLYIRRRTSALCITPNEGRVQQ